jgi:hypothetical protein
VSNEKRHATWQPLQSPPDNPCPECRAVKTHSGPFPHKADCSRAETTGERTKAKLADDAYRTSQLAQHTGSSVPGVPYDYETAEERYANAYMRTLGPARRKAPTPWTPTNRQLAVAGTIAAVIIVLLGWLLLSL